MRKTVTSDILRDSQELQAILRVLGRKQSLRDPIANALEQMQFTPAQVHSLLWLGTDGALTMGEIASRLGITEKTVTGVVDRLETEGYVQRHRSSEDRRIVHVKLTRTGSGIFRRFHSALQTKMSLLLSVLDPTERRSLIGILKKISERVPVLLAKQTSRS